MSGFNPYFSPQNRITTRLPPLRDQTSRKRSTKVAILAEPERSWALLVRDETKWCVFIYFFLLGSSAEMLCAHSSKVRPGMLQRVLPYLSLVRCP